MDCELWLLIWSVSAGPDYPSFRFLVFTFDMFMTNINLSDDWHSKCSSCLTFDTAFSGLIQKLTLPMDICFIVMSVTSEISQLLYLFFDLLVYYPINIHQSQQNLSCEKRPQYNTCIKHLHLVMKAVFILIIYNIIFR